ncbi:MAG: DUF6527 family protein [Geminicoccaceae bacterium]
MSPSDATSNEPPFKFTGEGPDGKPKWMTFPCPGGRGRCGIALRPHQKNGVGASWEWDGDREQPTITPSIDCRECGWHGWITKGQLIPPP